MHDSGKVRSIKPVYVFDVTQTDERTHRVAEHATMCRPTDAGEHVSRSTDPCPG
jgi:hypothetical protein